MLSDLHLGATNSVLSHVSADGLEIDHGAPAPALAALGACLRSLRGNDPAPQLVVLGDLIELALTPLHDAAITVGHFIEQTGLGQDDGAFDRTVRYVAGNHDHYLWTRARSDHDLMRLEQTPPGTDLPEPIHVTSMFPNPAEAEIPGRFVKALAEWVRPGSGIEVLHSYPNFGLVDELHQRAVVMHHGHFVEHLYRLVSALDLVFDASSPSRPPLDAAHMERDNGGWIDFFWSSEGDSGDVGSDVRMLYESLVSGRTLDAELDRITDLIITRRSSLVGKIEAWMAKRMLSEAHAVIAWRERHHGGGTLSAGAEKGLLLYMSGAIGIELQREIGGWPDEATFVFGHTHKPFTGTRGVTGVRRPVNVVNTGGWVVDHPRPEPVKGAVTVLVDDELNVASLLFYRQLPDGSASPPHVTAVGPRSGPFAEEIRRRMAANQPLWDRLTTTITDALATRRRNLDDREAQTRARLTRPGQ